MKEVKFNGFIGKLVGDMGGAAIMANVILGEELGLHRAMADGKLITVRLPEDSDRARTPGLTGLRGGGTVVSEHVLGQGQDGHRDVRRWRVVMG